MTEQRDHEEFCRQDNLPTAYKKVDHRFGSTRNFLQEQLRYSESVEDFRTVRQVILRSSEFRVGNRAFVYAKVPVEVRPHRPERR